MMALRAPRSTPAVAQRSGNRVSRRFIPVRAQAEKSALAKLSDAIGMPTSEGYFGFTPFAEQWVGRWAMLGFISSIVVEGATGKGTLAQVGLEAPSGSLLLALALLSGGATVAGSVITVQKILTRKMSRPQLERYRAFLGLTKKDDWMVDSTARSMQRGTSFTSPSIDMAAIEQVRAEGMPADRFLALDDKQEAQKAAEEMKAADAAPAPASQATMSADELYGMNDDDYARGVELANGRAAMLGFLAAILVEAGNGHGIILQIIDYLKWSGILGPMSGF